MRALIALALTLALTLPSFAANLPEQRLKDLVRRAADGSLGEIVTEVTPGAFESRPLVEQVVVYTGTHALAQLVSLGDSSPLKKAVPAAAWPKLIAAQSTLDQVSGAMAEAMHTTAGKALVARNIDASRLLVGTANLYLRQMGEAEDAAERAIDLFIASAAAQVGAQADLQAAMLKLSTDSQATAEVRQRAGFLYPLIEETGARAKVAVLQFHEQLGGGR